MHRVHRALQQDSASLTLARPEYHNSQAEAARQKQVCSALQVMHHVPCVFCDRRLSQQYECMHAAYMCSGMDHVSARVHAQADSDRKPAPTSARPWHRHVLQARCSGHRRNIIGVEDGNHAQMASRPGQTKHLQQLASCSKPDENELN
jgi:hypothetical protein